MPVLPFSFTQQSIVEGSFNTPSSKDFFASSFQRDKDYAEMRRHCRQGANDCLYWFDMHARFKFGFQCHFSFSFSCQSGLAEMPNKTKTKAVSLANHNKKRKSNEPISAQSIFSCTHVPLAVRKRGKKCGGRECGAKISSKTHQTAQT